MSTPSASNPLASLAASLRPAGAKALLRSVLPLVAWIGLAIVLQLLVRPAIDAFWGKIMLDIATNVILAVSLTIVNGFTGQFSMGHAAFMLVGAYTSASIVYYGSFRLAGNAELAGGILSSMRLAGDGLAGVPLVTTADMLFLGSLLAGGAVAAVCGYLVGLPSLRLRGDYLAIVTLGFGEIVRVIIQSQTADVLYDAQEIAKLPVYKWPVHTGGSLGFTGLPPYSSLFWAWLFAGITLLVAFRLKYSSTGRAMLSIREDEVAAAAMGVNTTKYKVRAFVIAALLAGIAGGIFAHTTGVQLNPGELGFQKSFDIIIMVVLGGLGSISGAAIAAALLTLLPEWLRNPPSVFPSGLVVLIPLAILIAIFAQRRGRALAVLAGVVAGWELMRWGAREAGINLAEYRMVLYAMMLITVMIVRPMGLLGVGEIWDRSLWTRRRRGKAKP